MKTSFVEEYFLNPTERNVVPWLEITLMVRWIVGSILHRVDPLGYLSFPRVLHYWYNKSRGMWYPVCGMTHIKEPLLLIGKSSPCGGSGFPAYKQLFPLGMNNILSSFEALLVLRVSTTQNYLLESI